ncbi:hypothetical protein RSJ19_11870 [Clostridium botulinum]|nr:hypothetical protein RSJ19_11870 [Clostridium botulinum]
MVYSSLKQKQRWHKKCLCLVEFENVEEISSLELDRQRNMEDWLIIKKNRRCGSRYKYSILL